MLYTVKCMMLLILLCINVITQTCIRPHARSGVYYPWELCIYIAVKPLTVNILAYVVFISITVNCAF